MVKIIFKFIKVFLVPPVIDRNSIQEIRVRTGQSFQMDIPVSGEPPPEIKWNFEGKSLELDDRLKISNVDYRTKFIVKRALRSDNGIFNITATNDSGTDTAQVKVKSYILLFYYLFFR